MPLHAGARAVFKYDGKIIKPAAQGVEYDEFLTHFSRLFMRIIMFIFLPDSIPSLWLR
jgi:hypothetical protein